MSIDIEQYARRRMRDTIVDDAKFIQSELLAFVCDAVGDVMDDFPKGYTATMPDTETVTFTPTLKPTSFMGMHP